ncbi:hypothetical protein KW792_00140 [Candidatus Saccharibacteria bacterium]|nr:hypothetical protein [Candidatus Saccharibacteria bacterium]
MRQKLTDFGNFDYRMSPIQSLAFLILKNHTRLLVDSNEPIESFDFVIFRNANVNWELAAAASLYLRKHDIDYANGMEGSGVWTGKLAQMMLYALNGIPVPDTVCVRNYSDLQSLARQNFPYPYVLKDSVGIRGKNNYLVESDNQSAEILQSGPKLYLAQKYIPNDGDFRVLFVGMDSEPLIFKRASSGSSHLNNTSQGATATMVPLGEFPEGALRTARQTAKLFGREIAGVDILFDAEGEHYVLETNETPALASGFALDDKVALVDNYMKEKLE